MNHQYFVFERRKLVTHDEEERSSERDCPYRANCVSSWAVTLDGTRNLVEKFSLTAGHYLAKQVR